MHAPNCIRYDGDWECAGNCTHDRDEARAAELALLREAAHRHVTTGHAVHCFGMRNPYHESHRCDCGFDEARRAIKEYGGGK